MSNISSLIKIKGNKFNTPKDLFNKLRASMSRLKHNCLSSPSLMRSRYVVEDSLSTFIEQYKLSYGIEPPANQLLAYYDDIYFLMNGIVYYVYYYHPRYTLSNNIEKECFDKLFSSTNKDVDYKLWKKEQLNRFNNITDEDLYKVKNSIRFYLGYKYIACELLLNKEVRYRDEQIELVNELRETIKNKSYNLFLSKYNNYSKEDVYKEKDDLIFIAGIE